MASYVGKLVAKKLISGKRNQKDEVSKYSGLLDHNLLTVAILLPSKRHLVQDTKSNITPNGRRLYLEVLLPKRPGSSPKRRDVLIALTCV